MLTGEVNTCNRCFYVEKVQSKRFRIFYYSFGLAVRVSLGIICHVFKKYWATLIYDKVMNFMAILNDTYPTEILFFMLDFSRVYLKWRGYEKQYNK